jgi:hypothetical protein
MNAAAIAVPSEASDLELLRLLRLEEDVDLDTLKTAEFKRQEDLLKKTREEMAKIVDKNLDYVKSKISEHSQTFVSINFLAQAQETGDALSQNAKKLGENQGAVGQGLTATQAETRREINDAVNLHRTLVSLQETMQEDAQHHPLERAVETAGNIASRSIAQNRRS